MEAINAAQFLSALGRTSMQAGVLVLVVLLAQWFFRRRLTPRWRCALWLLVVVRLMLPLSLASSTSIFNWLPAWNGRTTPAAPSSKVVNATPPPVSLETSFGGLVDPPVVTKEIPSAQSVVGVEAAKATVPPVSVGTQIKTPAARQISWITVAVAIWFVGVVVLLTHIMVSSVRLARRFAHLPPVTDPAVLAVLEDCRKLLDVRTKLKVVESGDMSSPALQGLIHPQLLLPKKFTGNFSLRELRHIFLHELAHVKRRDLWLNWLVALLQVAHWFNPLVWLAFARWRADRELACDAMALEAAGTEHRQAYGLTILRLLENFTHQTASPGMVGILEDKRQLKRRIEMIARFKPSPYWSVPALALVVIIAAGCLTDAKKNERVTTSNAAAIGDTLPYVLDLKPFYSRVFVEPKGTNSSYEGYFGRKIVDGLPFDVDGEIYLYGKSPADRNDVRRDEVSEIKIGRKFNELHLIHAVQWRECYGCPVATIRLHYADGTSHDFEIRYNFQVIDWSRLLSEEREIVADPDTKIIWRGPGVYKGTGRLFKTVLHNPFPNRMVDSLELISTHSRASYVLVAATVASHDPHRAVTPPLLLNQPERHFDGTLNVHVVDKETGAPIAGADVFPSMSVEGDSIVADPILTSSNGAVLVKYPVSRTSDLSVGVTKTGYSGRSGNWQSGSIPDEITYRLSLAKASVEGTVVDGAGQPVAGAEVRLNDYSWNNMSGDRDALPSEPAKTDATGHWSIQGMPESCQDFGLTVSYPDFPQAQFYTDGPNASRFNGQHIPVADFFSGKAVLKLSNGYKIAGTVRNQSGKPVAGATVFVGFDRYMSGAVKTNADAGGNYNLKNLGLGENYLTFSAPGFAPEFRTVTVTASNAPQDVILKPGKVIYGRVVDTVGKSVEGAEVSCDGLADRNGIFNGRTIEWKTQTDANGEFTWDSAPDKAINLTITKSGYMTLEWARVETDTTNVTRFTLSAPLTIKGSVMDADTGEPVAAFKVTPGWPENGGARLQKREAKSGVAGHYEVQFDHPLIISPTPYGFVFQISSPGYAPVKSRSIKPNEGVVTWDVKLKKTPATICSVKTADGKPAAGMNVFPVTPQDYLQLRDTQVFNQNQESDSIQTDADGNFELPPQPGDFKLVAASEAGFALMQRADLTNSSTLMLQPWGRMEGVLLNNGRPMVGQKFYFSLCDVNSRPDIWSQESAPSDKQGRFVFAHVPPGIVRIELKQPMGANSWSYLELATTNVEAGRTNMVQINLEGRPVTGHLQRNADLTNDVDFTQFQISLQPDVRGPKVPDEMDSPEKVQKWYQDWMKTDAGRKYLEAMRKRSQLQVKADGTFHADTVAPGKYKLTGNFWKDSAMLAQIDMQDVVVPEASTNNPDAPFDLGAVTVKAVKHLNVGDPAPDFSTKTLDGQALKLSDFKGKYVLLDFWATWCGPCVAETPNMKATYDAFGKDPKFVMISLSLDPKTSAPEKFVHDKDIQWLQGFLGDWSKDTVTKDYAVFGIPSIFLIGPDGKIIAQNLRDARIKQAVDSALKSH